MTTTLADAPASNPKRVALASLAKHRDFRGFTPFRNVDSDHVVDRANSFLSDASCILSVLAAAFSDSGALVIKGEGSTLGVRNGEIIAGAIDGVATLIDMAGYLLDAEGE